MLTAVLLITVINRRAFGWQIDFHITAQQFVNAFAVAMVAALVAGLVSGLANGARAVGQRHQGRVMKALLPIFLMSLAFAGCQRESSSREKPGVQSQVNAATPAEADRLSALRAEAMPTGFELADQPRRFDFPRDHGPHPTFRHEWWYVTGHLDAENGEPFGFELTFFRFALKPPASATRPQ